VSAIRSRPVFLDLLKIRLPVSAVLSIAHRATGLLLVLAIPPAIYLLDLSLSGPEGFTAVRDFLKGPVGQSALFLGLWVLLHHLLAGVRCLLIDMDLGVERTVSRKSAWAVILAAPLVALACVGLLL